MSAVFKIHLDSDTVVIQGTPEDSVGGVLRGYIILLNEEPLKVRSIKLYLTGKMKLVLGERKGNHHSKKEFNVLNHEWTLFSSDPKKPEVLKPSAYKYPFEFAIPGTVVESLETNKYGSLVYKLKAVVDRPSLLPNLIDRQLLRIVRQNANSILESVDNTPMILSKEWPQRLEYYISVPKRIFSRGESIPIDFKLIPNPDSDGIRIRSLTISLMEGITFKLNNDTQEESGDSSDEDKYYKTCRIVSYFKDESFSSEDFWEKTEVIVVPFSPEFIQCDTKNAYYKVEHRLKYVISLINHRDAVSELRATMPIYIIPSEDGNELPTYESSTRNTLYIPSPALLEDSTSPFEEDFFPRTPPHPIIDPSYPYTMMNSPTTNRQNNLVCPAGLPSYSTAMLSSSDMSPDELPSYE